MPEMFGRWSTGVVRRELFSAAFSFFVCRFLHQTSSQYSAAKNTRAWVEMQRIFVADPQLVPAWWRIRETWDVVFTDSFARCCQKARARSSFTPRNVSIASNCSPLPSTMTLSSCLASWLLRWNEDDMVFTTLSFKCQFLRLVDMVDMFAEALFDCLPLLARE